MEECKKKIEDGDKTWGEEREAWKKEKADLTMAKKGVENEKADAEARCSQFKLTWIGFNLRSARPRHN